MPAAGGAEDPANPPWYLIFFFGALAALGPLSIDAYLPGIPAMAKDFGVSVVSLQNTLNVFLVGYAIGQFFGGALSVKPLLQIVDGKVANLEKVRTSSKALNRLEALVLAAAGDEPVDVCVAHLASPDRAEQLAERLADELAENLGGREVWCTELGAVLGAHVGPGMVAVCVAPLL